MEDKLRLRKITGQDQDLLLRLCRSYVSVLMDMMAGEGSINRRNLDHVRTHVHSALEELFGMNSLHKDKELRDKAEKVLNQIMHGLPNYIDSPVPDPRSYSDYKREPNYIRANFHKIVNQKGRELRNKLIEDFSGSTKEDLEDLEKV